MKCTCWWLLGMRKSACWQHITHIVFFFHTFMKLKYSMPTVVWATLDLCAVKISSRSLVFLIRIVSRCRTGAPLSTKRPQYSKHGVQMYTCCACDKLRLDMPYKVHCANDPGSSKLISFCHKWVLIFIIAWVLLTVAMTYNLEDFLT